MVKSVGSGFRQLEVRIKKDNPRAAFNTPATLLPTNRYYVISKVMLTLLSAWDVISIWLTSY